MYFVQTSKLMCTEDLTLESPSKPGDANIRRSCHVAAVPGQRRLMEGELDEGDSMPSVQLSQFLTSLMHNTSTQLLLPSTSHLLSVFSQAGHHPSVTCTAVCFTLPFVVAN